MKRLFPILSIIIFAQIAALAQSFALDPSLAKPTGMVNDFANIIEDNAERQIEQKLRDFKAKTNPSVEIVVLTVKTTDNRPIFDYSLAVAREWGIGSKTDDNPSALLMIAVDDRKYFTQVSKDLEGDMPDGITGQLNRQYLVPAFKQANYGKGISDTIDAYISRIESSRAGIANKTEQQEPKAKQDGPMGTIFGAICCIIIIVFVLLIIFSKPPNDKNGGGGGSSNDRWRSGGFGGNTSNNSSEGSVLGPLILWGIGSGASSGSSDWGGSSGDSGGDSWGGFGGGGDFGGGGAGGDW